MFIALALGLNTICFFHILIHALAKANLFIVIGRLIHNRFAQQDARFIRSRTLNSFLILSISISLLSLIGIFFTSGFFSKEQILIGQSFIIRRVIAITILLLVTGLTLAYCSKLFIRVLSLNLQRLFQLSRNSISQVLPIFLLRRLRTMRGFILSFNLSPQPLRLSSIEYIYWSLRVIGVLFLSYRFTAILIIYYGFYSQSKLIDLLIKTFFKRKSVSTKLEASSREIFILRNRFLTIKVIKQRIRLIFLFSLLRFAVILF